MRNKLKFLIKNSLDKKVKTKWFKIVNILLLVLIVGIINLNSIIKSFGGDFDEKSYIYVNGDDVSYEIFKTNFDSYIASAGVSNYEVKKVDDIEEIKIAIKEDKNDNVIVDITNNNHLITGDIISYETIDTITYQVIEASLTSAKTTIYLASSDLTNEEKEALLMPISINRVFLSDSIDEYTEAKETLGSILIPLFIVPFFMLIILLVQNIGADINEEKSTRGMEIIISSVPPRTHFFSKIIGSSLFVTIQGLLFFVYAGIGLLIKNITGGETSSTVSSSISGIMDVLKSYGVMDNLIPAIIIIVLLFLISFVAYSLMAGILASMTTSIEDYQQLQSPIMIICVLGYYLAIMASVFEGSIFIKVASFLPFISTMLAPIMFILGQISLMELFISFLIMGGTVFILFRYGLRIYKIGILNYSSKDLWKKMFKSIKTKEV